MSPPPPPSPEGGCRLIATKRRAARRDECAPDTAPRAARRRSWGGPSRPDERRRQAAILLRNGWARIISRHGAPGAARAPPRPYSPRAPEGTWRRKGRASGASVRTYRWRRRRRRRRRRRATSTSVGQAARSRLLRPGNDPDRRASESVGRPARISPVSLPWAPAGGL